MNDENIHFEYRFIVVLKFRDCIQIDLYSKNYTPNEYNKVEQMLTMKKLLEAKQKPENYFKIEENIGYGYRYRH